MDVRNVVDGFGERISPEEVTAGHRADHIARYLFAAHFVSGHSVVDLCCGVGYGSSLLLAAGALRVHGIDADPQAIRLAREHYPGPDFVVARADESLDLRDVEVRICFEGIEHVSHPEEVLANMRGAELALISTPNADANRAGFSGNPHHVHEWTRRDFEAMLRTYFADVRLYFQWHYPDPLDQDWNIRTAAKAIVPVPLKARLNPPKANGPSGGKASITHGYRVYPASYLSLLPPGLRYGRALTWLALCRP
jgi:SAM-dependent methyltransferase